jgi:hypothetical protein
VARSRTRSEPGLIADLLAWAETQEYLSSRLHSDRESDHEERPFLRIQEELSDGLVVVRKW